MKLTTALSTAAALALAACGADPNPGPEATNMDAPLPANGAVEAPTENVTLAVAEQEPYGRYLTDSAGRAIYMLAPTAAGTSTEQEVQRCTGPCLASWPMVPAGMAAPSGVDGLQFGSVSREGGSQLTVNGVPAYYYTADRQPGLVSGQLLTDDFGTWHLIGADGKPVMVGEQRSKVTDRAYRQEPLDPPVN